MAIKHKTGVDIQKDVRELMEKHDLSREDLASRLGVCSMTVYRWGRGTNLPTSRLVLRAFGKLKQRLEKK